LLHGATTTSITIQIPKELKEKMEKVDVNWNEYLTEAIRRRVEIEKRKESMKRVLKYLKERGYEVPRGLIYSMLGTER